METLFHEYGHIIEEFIRYDNSEGNKKILEKLYEFRDMEDFAESFASWISKREIFFKEENNRFKDIINYYVEKVFTDESINWVRQEKWKRELDYCLDTNEKLFKKFETMIGALNNSKLACESLVKKMNSLGLDIKILKLNGYLGDISLAHPNLVSCKKENIEHYVLEFNSEWIVDLTAKQFSENNSNRVIDKKENYTKNWFNYYIIEENVTKKIKKLKF